jgi:histidinol-phosphate aminotransferase
MSSLQPNPDLFRTPPYAVPAAKLADPATALLLDQNENPIPPSPAAREAALKALDEAPLYPDARSTRLREAIAAAEGLDPDQVVCGHGSEELIFLIARAFAWRGAEIVFPRSTFAIFRKAGELAGATLKPAAERDLHVDVDAILAEVTDATAIVAVANPNNPTGVLVPHDEIRRLHAALSSRVLLILDAAYAEYVTDARYSPGHDLVTPDGNVAVFRSFSKAHSLAGLRCGWAHGSAEFCRAFNAAKPVYNLSRPSAAAAAASIADRSRLERVREDARRAAEAYQALWDELGLRSIQGATNFSYVEAPTPEGRPSLFEHLAAANIKVMPLGNYGLPDSLRIGFGTAEQNERVIAAVRAWAAL